MNTRPQATRPGHATTPEPPALPALEVLEAGTVLLGATTYRVEVHEWTYPDPQPVSTETYLIGPRGARYLLRGFLGPDTGLRQVISMTSGAPLRVRGNEIRVHQLGDIIETAPTRRER